MNSFKPYEFLPINGEKRSYYKNPLSFQPGCYLIKHVPSDNVYVGSSLNLAGRITGNINNLKNGKHKNKNLQKLFDESPNVEISYSVTDTEEEARLLEQETVNKLLDTGKLCNIAIDDVTKSSLGLKRTQETREKMSSSQNGRKVSSDGKKNMSEAQKKYLETPEGQKRLQSNIAKISKTVTIMELHFPLYLKQVEFLESLILL